MIPSLSRASKPVFSLALSPVHRLTDFAKSCFPPTRGSEDLRGYVIHSFEGCRQIIRDFEIENNLAGFAERQFLQLSLNEIKKLIRSGDQVFLDAEDLIDREMLARRTAVSKREQACLNEALKNQNPVTNFFPAFFATLKTAFLFFQPGKVPTIIWECSLLLGLYFQIFGAPYYLLVLLSSSLGTAGAAAAIAAFVVLGAACLSLYFERDESHPEYLPPFELKNLVPFYRNGGTTGCVGRDGIVEGILRFLHDTPQTRQAILIVGENGSGKTMLLNKIAEEVAKRSPDWGVYPAKKLLDATFNSYCSTPEGRKDTVERVLGRRQRKTVFLVDEWLGDVINDKTGNTASFLKDTLSKTQICFIFTIGKDQFRALDQADEAMRKEKGIEPAEGPPSSHGQMKALLERFDIVNLEEHASEELTKRMVRSGIDRMKEYVMCEPGIEEAAITLTKSPLKARLPNKLMKKAITEVKKTFEAPSHSSDKLQKLQAEQQKLLDEYRRDRDHAGYTDAMKKKWAEIQTKYGKIVAEENKLAEKTAEIQKVGLLGRQILSCEQRIGELAENLHQCMSDENLKRLYYLENLKRLYYLVYVDLPCRKKIFKEMQKKIPPEYPTIVNEELLGRLA